MAVAQGDGTGLIEHEDVDVAGGLDGAAGHGQHVGLVQSAHTGDANGGQQRTNGGGRQTDEQGNERGHSGGVRHTVEPCRETRVAVQCERHEDEDDGQGNQKDLERDLVGGLLAGGALDHGDHLIQEALARLAGDFHHNPIGKHGGAASDGRTVAASLANHGCRLAGDGRLINRGGTLDDIAVSRNLLAGAHDHQIPARELGTGNDREAVLILDGLDAMGLDVLFRRAQGVCLRLTAALGKCLGKI